MSEIGTFIRDKRFVRTDIINDGIPCIHYGDIYTYYGLYATQSKGRLKNELASKMRYAQKNDVVIVAAGENKEDIGIGLAWIGDEPAAVHDACFIFSQPEKHARGLRPACDIQIRRACRDVVRRYGNIQNTVDLGEYFDKHLLACHICGIFGEDGFALVANPID